MCWSEVYIGLARSTGRRVIKYHCLRSINTQDHYSSSERWKVQLCGEQRANTNRRAVRVYSRIWRRFLSAGYRRLCRPALLQWGAVYRRGCSSSFDTSAWLPLWIVSCWTCGRWQQLHRFVNYYLHCDKDWQKLSEKNRK